ncbi:MAG: SxtJ family membrane protein [Magnetococcus sp. YQC-5]
MKRPLQTNRTFGLSFAFFLGAISGVGWYFFGHITLWTVWGAGIFLLLALTRPVSLLLFNRLWCAVTGLLGIISNHLILGLVFYGIMTPLGLARQLFGKDSMGRRAFTDPQITTFLTPLERQTTPETFRDIF